MIDINEQPDEYSVFASIMESILKSPLVQIEKNKLIEECNEVINANDLELLEEDIDVVTLTLDNDEVVKCEVIGIFEVEEREYIALVPVSDEESDVLIYRYSEDAEGNPVLDNIETDEEFDIVGEAFDELLDELEFDEEFEEDEE